MDLPHALTTFRARYVLIPVVVSLAALLSLFLAARTGQDAVVVAGQRAAMTEARHDALSEVLALLAKAQAGERGYLISENPAYLDQFEGSAAGLPPILDRLEVAFRSEDPTVQAQMQGVRLLVVLRLEHMKETLALFRGQNRAAALARIDADASGGRDAATPAIRELQRHESAAIKEATGAWHSSLRSTRILTAAGAALNVVLVILAAILVVRDGRRRAEMARALAARSSELERLVEERTADLSELSTHIQRVAEQERLALARELHDELGSLLVAARMDLAWLEHRLPPGDRESADRLARVNDSLRIGVDVKRRVVERLRPSLLDHMGLFAALRWQLEDACSRAGLRYTQHYSDAEPTLTEEASIAVFRILQEALTNVLKHSKARHVQLRVEAKDDELLLRIADDGIGFPPERLKARGARGVAAMRHRAVGLGGSFSIRPNAEGGTIIEVRLPIARNLRPPAPATEATPSGPVAEAGAADLALRSAPALLGEQVLK